MSVVTTDQEKVFAAYLKDRKVLIADASPSSKSSIHSAMTELGAKPTNIFIASTYEDAEDQILKQKPQIVLCDYNLGVRCGLDLLQKQRKEQPDTKKSLFVLVTGNTSQAAVARAAEEDVDGYIIKPFTAFSLRQILMRTAVAKINPSDYSKLIDQAKQELAEARIDEAIKTLEAAKTLNPAPSLACFYLGQAEIMKKAMEKAEGKFGEGLNYNKIHYKCLTGLFDVLMEQKRFLEAYEVVKKISQYFPANPQRLTAVLKLAIQTKSYDDVEKYYQLFTRIDNRSDEVNRYMCAALVVCGKYYMGAKVQSRALELFKKAAITGAHRPKVMQEIIVCLVEGNQSSEIADFFKKIPPALQSTPAIKALDLYVFDKTRNSASLTIEKGRKLLTDGVFEPLIYQTLLKRASEEGLKQMMEDLMFQGSTKFPELKDKLQLIAEAGTQAAIVAKKIVP